MRISGWSSDVCSSDLYVHRAQDAAFGILDGLDADQRREARAVRALDDDLLVAPGAAAGEHRGHGALVVRHEAAVERVQTIGSAEADRGAAALRRLPPQFRRRPVIVEDAALAFAYLDFHGPQAEDTIGEA